MRGGRPLIAKAQSILGEGGHTGWMQEVPRNKVTCRFCQMVVVVWRYRGKCVSPLVLSEIWFMSVALSNSPPFLASLTKATTTLSKQFQIRRTLAQMKANMHVHRMVWPTPQFVGVVYLIFIAKAQFCFFPAFSLLFDSKHIFRHL